MDQRGCPVEGVMLTPEFWRGKRVFLTGHTGFKGSWLVCILSRLGAEVHGFALDPDDGPNLFDLGNVAGLLASDMRGDIRDAAVLEQALQAARPDIVFHLAAQSLVHASYEDPLGTLATNIMGTAHLFEGLRKIGNPAVVVNVTSDKCYENREWVWPYRENEPMGGKDIYSVSKGCAELLTTAYRQSFLADLDIATATARAGNVIGGGDWADNRLIPDMVRAMADGQAPVLRAPDALRPWQHVLEPLSGYLMLAEHLAQKPDDFAEGWNFGPGPTDTRTVAYVVETFLNLSHSDLRPVIQPHAYKEAQILKLDSAKANAHLGWTPRWSIDQALSRTADWYRAHVEGQDMATFTMQQIGEYFGDSLGTS